jgi:hypothetical protein
MNTFPSDRLREDVSMERLQSLSNVQLSILYQELLQLETPERFDTHADAVAAVEPFLGDAIAIMDEPLPPTSKRLNKPYYGHVRKRKKSKREAAIRLMLRPQGATPQECMIAGRWSFRQFRQELHHIHQQVGFGVREADDGRMFLHTEKKDDARNTD